MADVQHGEWTDGIDDSPEPEPETKAVEPEVEFTKAFPDEFKLPFEGLAYVGYLEDVVTIPFHTFHIRTLYTGEKIEVALICKELQDTVGYAKAYRAAVVAAAVQTVDGQQILIAEKQRGAIRQKYEYIVNTWFDSVIDIIFERVNALEGEVQRIMDELILGKGGR